MDEASQESENDVMPVTGLHSTSMVHGEEG